MTIDLHELATELEQKQATGASSAPSQGAASGTLQDGAAAEPENSGLAQDATVVPEPEAPLTPEITSFSSNDIKKEGDEFVYRGPVIKDADGAVIGQTVYRGASPDEVVQQIVEGKAEADKTIARLRKSGMALKATETLRFHKNRADTRPADDEPDDQSDDSVLPDAPPILREIQEQVLTEEVRAVRLDTRLLSLDREGWRKYQDENELRDHEVSDLKALVKTAIDRTRQRSSEIFTQQSTDFKNAMSVKRETDRLAEYIEKNKVDITPEEYQEVLNQVLATRSSFDTSRILKPGTIFAATLEYVNEKKKPSGRAASPAAVHPSAKTGVSTNGDRARQAATAAGARSAGAGARATVTTTVHQAKSLEEAGRAALKTIRERVNK